MASLQEARLQALQAAHDLLEGRTDALQAARVIDRLRWDIDPDLKIDSFRVFTAIASESDNVMMTDTRKGPPSEATTPLWIDYLHTEAFYRNDAETAAKELVALLENRPT